jgi:hypothetical protein
MTTTTTRALILALTFLSVFLLASPLRAATDQEVMHLLGILADTIRDLEAEFERWTAAGNPAANWDTSPRGVELARLRNELANVAEDAAQRGLIPRTPPPGPAPAGSRWVRALKGGVWVWTAVRVLTSSDPGREALDVGIGTICSYAGAVVGTVCFGPAGGVVGGIAGGVLAPGVGDFAAGSGGREPDVKPAPPPPAPPLSPVAATSSSSEQPQAANLAGTWQCPARGILTIAQNGTNLSMTFSGPNPGDHWGNAHRKGGSGTGTVTGQTANIQVRHGDGTSVTASMTLVADGQSFNGGWQWFRGTQNLGSGSWSCNR